MNTSNLIKYSIFFISIIFTQNTLAWDFVVSRGGTSVYIQKTSIERNGEFIQAVSVSNSTEGHRIKTPGGYLRKKSIRSLTIYDCIGKKFALQDSIWYDEEFAQGQGYRDSKITTFFWIGPESKIYERNLNVEIMKIVCAK